MEFESNSDGNSIEVLVVDDSPTQADKLKFILERRGCSVRVAANGKEALDFLSRDRSDIVITDVVMPEMDGYELCRRIRADAGLKDIPVILVTALSDPTDVIKGLQAGANNFITKPYDERYLVSRMQYLIANMELRRNSKAEMGINVFFSGGNYFITAERLQILDLLLSTYENAYHQNQELIETQNELRELNERLEKMVSERTNELAAANERLSIELMERKQAEEEVARAKEEWERTEMAKMQAEAQSKAKSDFLAGMSHELRTPLNSIIGFSQVLQEYFVDLNDQEREYLRYIEESGNHLLNLINDILDLSKIEAGRMELETDVFPLRRALSSSLTMFREKAMKHNLRLSLDITEDAETEIEADERKLKQVVFNLLSNAVKFTQDHGSVRLSARMMPDENVEISVADTGVGIQAENIPRLFEEFSQFGRWGLDRSEGTGLGLSIAKKIVELHGGRIWVESKFGRGSVFTFVIPARRQRKNSRL